jgi:hypothetical protein
MAQLILSKHCVLQAREKGIDLQAIRDAAINPDVTYESNRYPGQYKYIKGDICAVVDPERAIVITVFLNVVRTPLRKDQMVEAFTAHWDKSEVR